MFRPGQRPLAARRSDRQCSRLRRNYDRDPECCRAPDRSGDHPKQPAMAAAAEGIASRFDAASLQCCHFSPKGRRRRSASCMVCLALVLAFEFSNGFHDTANAVATVIYTNSLKPLYAVVWSGLMNFLGVLLGGIAVAYALVQLIPPEVLSPPNGGTAVGMLVALFIAALVWNVGDVVARASELKFARADRRAASASRSGIRSSTRAVSAMAWTGVRSRASCRPCCCLRSSASCSL